MCVARLEDVSGTISITVFPRTYEETSDQWTEGNVVIVSGEVQLRNDEPCLIAQKIDPVRAVEEEMNRKRYLAWLTLRRSGNDEVAISNDVLKVQDLHKIIQANPGRDHFEIVIVQEEEHWQVRLTPDVNTFGYTPQLQSQIEAVLGANSVELMVVQ